MSFLTKFFIVLHVVLTMLFVAATIVFVNRVENFSQTDAKPQGRSSRLAQRQAQARSATPDDAQRRRAGGAAAGRRPRSTACREQLNNDRGRRPRARHADVANAPAGTWPAPTPGSRPPPPPSRPPRKTNTLLQEQLTETRKASDKIQQQNTELLTANADLEQPPADRRSVQNATDEEIETLQTPGRRRRPRGVRRRRRRASRHRRPRRPAARSPINGVDPRPADDQRRQLRHDLRRHAPTTSPRAWSSTSSTARPATSSATSPSTASSPTKPAAASKAPASPT